MERLLGKRLMIKDGHTRHYDDFYGKRTVSIDYLSCNWNSCKAATISKRGKDI